MADAELDDKNIPLIAAEMSDLIKKADKVAGERFTQFNSRLDNFIKESSKKEKQLSKQPEQKNVEKKPDNVSSQQTPTPQSQEENVSKDTDVDELKNTVVAEVSNKINDTNDQLENLEKQDKANAETVLQALEKNIKEQPATTKQDTDINKNNTEVRKDSNQSVPDSKQVLKTESEQELPSSQLPEQSKPAEIKVVVEPKQEQVSVDRSNIEKQPTTNIPETIPQPEASSKEKEIIKVIEKNKTEDKDTQPPLLQPPQENIPLDVAASVEVQTSEPFKIAESTTPIPPSIPEAIVPESVPTIAAQQPPLEKETPNIEVSDKKITEETVAKSNNIENNEAETVQPAVTAPETADIKNEPFTTTADIPQQNIPEVIESNQKNVPTLNASDENLLAISKGIEMLSQTLKQNQDKLINSITNLNNTATEILRLLPTLQQQAPTGEMGQGMSSRGGRSRSGDTSNIIGSFRDSLNITARGYNRNTILPGNNSIT